MQRCRISEHSVMRSTARSKIGLNVATWSPGCWHTTVLFQGLGRGSLPNTIHSTVVPVARHLALCCIIGLFAQIVTLVFGVLLSEC